MTSTISTDGVSFDIVIPCYNYARFLRKAVESVLAQEVSLRVLIIDDASQDDSAAVGRALADQDGRVTFLRHPGNRGHIATYNEGIAWAEADFFTIVSADDFMLPGALERAGALFLREPRISMVHGRAVEFEDEASIEIPDGAVGEQRESQVLTTRAFYRENRERNRVHASSVVTRTCVQKRAGGYLPELPHAGDYEMWLRLAAHGLVGYVPQFQTAVRRHARNMSLQYSYEHDILQRALSLRAVDAAAGSILPEGLMMEMRSGVAVEAVRAAGIPFARGDEALRDELEAAALALDPAVTGSLAWKLHKFKRFLGRRAWNRIRNCKQRSVKTIGQVRALLASAPCA